MPIQQSDLPPRPSPAAVHYPQIDIRSALSALTPGPLSRTAGEGLNVEVVRFRVAKSHNLIKKSALLYFWAVSRHTTTTLCLRASW